LSLWSFEGEVLERQGNPRDFDGAARILVFDSEKEKSHQMPNGQSVDYRLPGGVIFRGNAQVEGGRFSSRFVVPKDISYGGETARISVYIHNQVTDGSGVLDSLVVYGSDTTVVDTTGPLISVNLAVQSDFQQGNGMIEIEISDSNGINLTRELGHGITLVIDEDFQHPVDLTDLFEYYEDDYQRGSVLSHLPHLPRGEHTLRVKAWDNFSNSTLEEVKITIFHSEEFQIADVMNYPNPFSDSTYICYNVYGSVKKVQIRIFTLSGQLIRNIGSQHPASGFNSIIWNGEDQDGDRVANGVYIYEIRAEDEEEKETQAYGKAVVMR